MYCLKTVALIVIKLLKSEIFKNFGLANPFLYQLNRESMKLSLFFIGIGALETHGETKDCEEPLFGDHSKVKFSKFSRF